jgi:hypothetical protein
MNKRFHKADRDREALLLDKDELKKEEEYMKNELNRIFSKKRKALGLEA